MLAAGVGGWMWYGDINEGGRADSRPATIEERNASSETKLFKVQATFFTSQRRESVLNARGITEASGKVAIRTETQGLLRTRHVKKGQWVEAGDLICSLNVGARQATVQQRQAQLQKAVIDYEAAAKLAKDGFATTSRLSGDKATVDEAKAELKAAEIELDRTNIKAPISGIIQDPFAKIGDMLQVGDICANVIEPGTMTMIAQISERDVGQIHIGGKAGVDLVTGEPIEGKIKYIAPSADPETRTFRIEIELPNPDNKILDGITAVAHIHLDGKDAHKLPASALTLNDAGELGVRVLNTENIVSFLPVKIVGDAADGLWVSGLPETVKVITRGQEYVISGQQVDPVLRTAEVSK